MAQRRPAGVVEVDIEKLREICGRYGVAELLVFGSTARGTAHATSDIDLLYRLQPGVRLGWEVEQLNDELEELLGRPVDLVSARSLHPRLREPIDREARQLYAA